MTKRTQSVDVIDGDLYAEAGTVYECTEIKGSLDASGADTKTAFPKLTTVGGYLDASGADTKTAFPKLTTVGGYLYASGADTKTAFPKLTTVGGYLDARGADTKIAFPKLTTVGGYLYARGADTKTAFPKLTTVGGYLYARGADTKTAFPKLTRQGAGDTEAVRACSAAMTTALGEQGLILTNGILSCLVSRRGGVSRVVVVGQSKVSYIVERDGQTAHGATLALARADLLLKLGQRDTSVFKTWSRDTEKPIEEMIAAYRAITGACGLGVEHFLRGKSYPSKLTVAFVLKETKGQYGHKQFAQFFQ